MWRTYRGNINNGKFIFTKGYYVKEPYETSHAGTKMLVFEGQTSASDGFMVPYDEIKIHTAGYSILGTIIVNLDKPKDLINQSIHEFAMAVAKNNIFLCEQELAEAIKAEENLENQKNYNYL